MVKYIYALEKYNKRRVTNIKKKVKYYSRKAIKYTLITVVLTFILLLIGYLKFKPVFIVKFNGQAIGIVNDSVQVESELDSYLKNPVAPVAVATIDQKPEFELTFAAKNVETDEVKVKDTIDSNIEKTYKFYEVKLADEVFGVVSSEEEAQKVVNEIKEERGYDTISYNEMMTKENKTDNFTDVKTKVLAKVITVQDEEKAKAVEERKAAEEKRQQILLASATVSRGNTESLNRTAERISSVATSTSASASSSLGGMKFINPIASPRWGVGYMGYSGHSGVDILGGGNAARASASGTVTTVADLGRRSYGRYIVVDHGNGISTLYAHLSSMSVSVGQRVTAGQTIGITGSTGNSTGPHLHFEIRVNGRHVNPRPYI